MVPYHWHTQKLVHFFFFPMLLCFVLKVLRVDHVASSSTFWGLCWMGCRGRGREPRSLGPQVDPVTEAPPPVASPGPGPRGWGLLESLPLCFVETTIPCFFCFCFCFTLVIGPQPFRNYPLPRKENEQLWGDPAAPFLQTPPFWCLGFCVKLICTFCLPLLLVLYICI